MKKANVILGARVTGKISVGEYVLTLVERATIDDPITARQIVQYMRMRGCDLRVRPQEIQDAVHSLRVAGYPICATPFGYYWPKDSDELHDYVVNFGRRVKALCRAMSGLKNSYGNIKQSVDRTISAID